MANSSDKKGNRLPLAKIEHIMKRSDGCGAVSAEAVFVVRKATELFIAELAQKALNNNNTNQPATLDYKQLADVVQADEKLSFIHEMVPKKVTVEQFKELMALKAARKIQFGHSDDDSSEEETQNVKKYEGVIK